MMAAEEALSKQKRLSLSLYFSFSPIASEDDIEIGSFASELLAAILLLLLFLAPENEEATQHNRTTFDF